MTPLASMTSASLTLATVTPIAPAAIWRWVMAGHLCPLSVRSPLHPCRRIVLAMCAILRSIVSISISTRRRIECAHRHPNERRQHESSSPQAVVLEQCAKSMADGG